MSDIKGRMKSYSRNEKLESLLSEVNQLLTPASLELLQTIQVQKSYPTVFVHGALRSGTTLFMQWLAASGAVAYPTNMLSRFYHAPLIGLKIQQLLTDPEFQFRDELEGLASHVSFDSHNGKTKGALSPNEFWYFWRRFLPYKDIDYCADELIIENGDLAGMKAEVDAMSSIQGKPFAMKAMIMNQNVLSLQRSFPNALFIWIKRDPVFNVQSVLEARQRQYGNMDKWYSFKIREYPEIRGLPAIESAAAQVECINNSLSDSFSVLEQRQRLIVDYEDFCINPASVFDELIRKLDGLGHQRSEVLTYQGPNNFSHSNSWRIKEYTEAQVRDVVKNQ